MITSSEKNQEHHYDIIIVGGGIVGLTMANCLLKSNLKVAIVERNEPASISEKIDNRVSAINRVAIDKFQSIGVWQHMLENRVSPFYKMHVWDSSGVGEIDFDSADTDGEALGYIIENTVISLALRKNLQASDNIQWLCPREIQSVSLTQNTQFVVLDNGETLSCDLIIGADGAQSKVRLAANIDFISNDYQQLGVVTTVETEYPHQQTAWQCFLPSGPLAFLPITENQCSIVWSLDENQADLVMSANDKTFARQLEQAFEYKLGQVTSVTPRAVFPLKHGHVNAYVQTGLALIGDAAHIIHPLAGQGANLGILDAICLADVVLHAKANNRQWSAMHTLRRYERARKGDNLLMESAMSGFKTLFGNDDPLVSAVRNAGLNMVNQLPLLKSQLMQQALGLS